MLFSTKHRCRISSVSVTALDVTNNIPELVALIRQGLLVDEMLADIGAELPGILRRRDVVVVLFNE